MRHWSQLATRNWPARPVRTFGAVLAIALGTGAVVWVTCCYESVRQTTRRWSGNYVGASDINVESPMGKYNQLPQRLVSALRKLDVVKTLTPRLVLRRRADALPAAEAGRSADEKIPYTGQTPELDLVGIDLKNEFQFRTYTVTRGRMLSESDELACVLEESFAHEKGVGVGDFVRIWTTVDDHPHEVKIVGLMKRRRIARFQKALALLQLPTLQKIAYKQGLVTSVDIVLRDISEIDLRKHIRTADEEAFKKRRQAILKEPHRSMIALGRGVIRRAVRKIVPNANVTSSETRLRQIDAAQDQQEFVLTLLSYVAMLTALFIILSTLSMGMVERISQLGLLRCIGVTRSQLAGLMLLEVLPLGVVGVATGVPVGLGLMALTVLLVPSYVGHMAVSWPGIGMAVGAGLATTLLAATLPAIAVLSVSPLEASRPRARKPARWLLAAVFFAAAGLWIYQAYSISTLRRSPNFVNAASLSVVLLYVAYGLFGPVCVRLFGWPTVAMAAALTRVRVRLLQDQVGHAVWRSAGICCGLMVGLSLIVALMVFSESVRRGWDFPTQFPEAYMWSYAQMRDDTPEIIAKVDGIREFTAANAINVIVEERPLFMEKLLKSVTWFMGCDPDSFLPMMNLQFVELDGEQQGELEEARELLKKGGYILIAKDFALARNKRLGDKVRVWSGNRQFYFKVAGVVESPALDLAATYFQAQSELRVAAVGSVIGTNADLRRIFKFHGYKLVLLNFDLPPEPPPLSWPPKLGTAAAAGLSAECYDETVPLEQRWKTHRETAVLKNVRKALDANTAFIGTVQELKHSIDIELSGMTRLLTAVPAVALLVAAIGVANLMTANVTSRLKQLAILRAVGATRGLVMRMVVGESLVLGLLGSGLGLVLGLHLASDIRRMTLVMYGLEFPFQPVWGYVAAAVSLCVGLCILAGLIPARHASRTNVIDALHTV